MLCYIIQLNFQREVIIFNFNEKTSPVHLLYINIMDSLEKKLSHRVSQLRSV